MSIEVMFRGPILLLSRGDTAVMALIPDAARDMDSHPDGTATKRHDAGLLIARGDEAREYRSLRGKLVSLIAGDGGQCLTDPDFNEVAPIDELAADGDGAAMTLISGSAMDYWERVATRIMFTGGRLRGALWSTAEFRFETTLSTFSAPRSLPLGASWVGSGDAVEIRITNADGSDPETIRVSEGEQAYIYNWHPPEPSVTQLMTLPECIEGSTESEDTDFKWLYELFDSPQAMTASPLKLRAPLSRCKSPAPEEEHGIFSPGSSGCVAGRATYVGVTPPLA